MLKSSPHAISSERWSPNWLATKIDIQIDSFCRLVASRTRLVNILIFLLGLPLAVALMGSTLTADPERRLGSLELNSIHLILGFTILLGIFSRLFGARIKNGLVGLLTLAFIAFLSVRSPAEHFGAALISLVLPLVGFFSYIWRPSRWTAAAMLLAPVVGIYVGFRYLTGEVKNVFASPLYSAWYSTVLLFYAAEWRARPITNRSLRSFLPYLFNPAHLIVAVVSPSKLVEATSDRSYQIVFALIKLLFTAVAVALLVGYFGPLEFLHHRPDGALPTLGYGYLKYLKYFLVSYVTMTGAEIGLRFLGFNIITNFRTPLLAVTPHERWQRWSVSVFLFVKNMVFIPLIRRFRSPAFAILATFVISYFIHELLFLERFAANGLTAATVGKSLSRLIFFLLHGLAVYFSMRMPKLWPSGDTLRGWLSLSATHLLMAIIHIFAP